MKIREEIIYQKDKEFLFGSQKPYVFLLPLNSSSEFRSLSHCLYSSYGYYPFRLTKYWNDNCIVYLLFKSREAWESCVPSSIRASMLECINQ